MNKLFTISILTSMMAFFYSAVSQGGPGIVPLEFQNRTGFDLVVTAKSVTTKGMPVNCVLTIPKNPFTIAARSNKSFHGTYDGCPSPSFVFATNFFVQPQLIHLEKKFNKFTPYIHFDCSSDNMECSSNMFNFPLVVKQNQKTIKINAFDTGSANPFTFRFMHLLE